VSVINSHEAHHLIFTFGCDARLTYCLGRSHTEPYQVTYVLNTCSGLRRTLGPVIDLLWRFPPFHSKALAAGNVQTGILGLGVRVKE